jgi:cell fate regulator YaaT (PSP1 superfamily)
MGCAGCNNAKDGVPTGCGSKGHCTSGSCNKMNTYDWLTNMDLHDPTEYQYMEVSFKSGAHKDFFKTNNTAYAVTGDMVVVESSSGYDVGRVSLSGELVRLQMKKKRISEDRVVHKVIRRANERDLEKLNEARSREVDTMIRSRAIARTLDLDMKIGDVEYQGDNRKATFYYTAEGRVDFRELVRHYANEFRVKIEMRQIGSRQESGRIGGLGPCGRELCCSTWLSNFKSVNTSAARYQNLAINQTKLSGQCGRLKCCLNYELDTYLDALSDFPEHAERLRTSEHRYELIKTDIFKGIMYYIQILDRGRGAVVALPKERVKEILEMNKNKEFPDELAGAELASIGQEKDDLEFEDLTGHIELPADPKKRGSRHSRSSNRERGGTESKERGPNQRRSNQRGPRSDNRNKSEQSPNNRNSNSSGPNKGTNDGRQQPPKVSNENGPKTESNNGDAKKPSGKKRFSKNRGKGRNPNQKNDNPNPNQ